MASHCSFCGARELPGDAGQFFCPNCEDEASTVVRGDVACGFAWDIGRELEEQRNRDAALISAALALEPHLDDRGFLTRTLDAAPKLKALNAAIAEYRKATGSGA